MSRMRDTGCPIAYGLDIFGDRWSLLVLRDLIFEGKTRFQEFLASAERISTNILAARLEQLACAGLIGKVPDPADGRRTAYAPTAKGLDLVPMILEMVRWSAKHDPHTAAPQAFLHRLERDRDGLIAELRARFEETAPDGRHRPRPSRRGPVGGRHGRKRSRSAGTGRRQASRLPNQR